MKRSLKIIILSSFVFLVCGAPSIRFKSVRPALINIPGHIQSIGIIDRSEIPKTATTTLEKVITAELPGESKAASQMALEGFAGFLQNSQRFTIVRSGIVMEKESRPTIFPEPLSWDEVESICKKLNTDGIVALEVFNSDYIIPTSMAIVTIGFRFYDPSQRMIIDQEQFRHEIAWNRQITSGFDVVGRMLDKDKATREASFQAGGMYGQRISPSWFTISREYYKKPKKRGHLGMGARMMEANDWNAAIESLTKAVDTGKRKVQGRAAHNLAVVYEILGDLETSKSWAQQAWGMYRNKGSKNYSYILNNRISEQKILEYQENQ